MNQTPKEFVRVPHGDLHAFVSKAAQTVGLPKDKSEMLAELLTANDLRGTFSHGTQQIATYAILMRDGILNNKPKLKVKNETPVSLMMDGDGGLGYFPSYEGTLRVIEKAMSQGIAVMQTRNHGHFGAAGIYSRMTLAHDLVTYVTSGHQLNLSAGDPVYSAAGGSPMSFSAPAGEEDALVLDFGAMHDFYGGSPHREEIARVAPGVILRSIGLGAICQTFGGLLAGVPLDEERAEKKYKGANQGSLVITFRIDLFLDPATFKREMDEYVRRVRTLTPVEGFEQAYLPGGPEAERERINLKEGVPVGTGHRERLEKLAGELGIEVPW
ncbi:MAG: Ldh family oxidoreductase [bacterium]|nr:Ldh family oxidoreductase [bacterium]